MTSDERDTRIKRHLETVRKCVCGRSVKGNAYYSHVRACKGWRAAVERRMGYSEGGLTWTSK
jgi:hypothetical protein